MIKAKILDSRRMHARLTPGFKRSTFGIPGFSTEEDLTFCVCSTPLPVKRPPPHSPPPPAPHSPRSSQTTTTTTTKRKHTQLQYIRLFCSLITETVPCLSLPCQWGQPDRRIPRRAPWRNDWQRLGTRRAAAWDESRGRVQRAVPVLVREPLATRHIRAARVASAPVRLGRGHDHRAPGCQWAAEGFVTSVASRAVHHSEIASARPGLEDLPRSSVGEGGATGRFGNIREC